ncbi:hypothetical protein CRE_08053 [Caenorhabditis remanei]|uniref:Uncharacterized protein n=1 Tax=Caenorhabditis remanei TaxID=31234 RepID=E3M346_CAERE|nr:hypothetical protein CRE_08053 [Caenorhabditis remanei]
MAREGTTETSLKIVLHCITMEMEDYGGGEFVYESDEWEDGEIDLRDDDEIDRKKEKELRMRNRKTIIYLKYVDKHLKGMKKLNKELVDSDEAETIDKSTAARMIDVSSTSRFFSDFMSSETPAETSDKNPTQSLLIYRRGRVAPKEFEPIMKTKEYQKNVAELIANIKENQMPQPQK